MSTLNPDKLYINPLPTATLSLTHPCPHPLWNSLPSPASPEACQSSRPCQTLIPTSCTSPASPNPDQPVRPS
ncbi:hypothetical protein JB92DRAFT_2877983 [Gautieria morchelliformis]|nr:hypothetical protein JB92DRAFT_2877983 [Gautieria morchelliformis]